MPREIAGIRGDFCCQGLDNAILWVRNATRRVYLCWVVGRTTLIVDETGANVTTTAGRESENATLPMQSNRPMTVEDAKNVFVRFGDDLESFYEVVFRTLIANKPRVELPN